MQPETTGVPVHPSLSRIELATAILLGMSVPVIGIGKSVMAVVLLAASALVVAFFHREHGWWRLFTIMRSAFGLAVTLTFVFWLASALGSDEIAKSVQTWALTAFCVVMTVVFYLQIQTRPEQLRVMQRSLLITAFIIVAYADFIILADTTPLQAIAVFFDKTLDAGLYFKPYSSVVICMLPIIVWIGWRHRGVWRYLAAGTGILMILNIIAYAFPLWNITQETGYSALLGSAAAAIIIGLVFLCRPLPGKARRVFFVGFIALTLLATGVVFERLPVPPAPESSDQFAALPVIDWHRQVIWGFAYSQFFNSPVIGFGPNTINTVAGANDTIPGMNQEYIPSHPHNWLLEMMAETGVLGSVAIILLLLLLARHLLRLALESRAEGWAGLALMGAFWGSALTNFSIWATWWQLTFLLLIMMVLSSLARPEGSDIS